MCLLFGCLFFISSMGKWMDSSSFFFLSVFHSSFLSSFLSSSFFLLLLHGGGGGGGGVDLMNCWRLTLDKQLTAHQPTIVKLRFV